MLVFSKFSTTKAFVFPFLSTLFQVSIHPVRSFSIERATRLPLYSQSSTISNTIMTAAASAASTEEEEDPYIFLEQVESEESLHFAKQANDACLQALGDPTQSGTGTYDRVLAVLESNDRIPYCSKYGYNEHEEEVLVNFWKDSKNPKGLWRKTTMESYKTDKPEWTTILDLDELSKKDNISWVWKGAKPLARARDPLSLDGKRVTRALLHLSRGGADAVHVKEFDFLTSEFVPPQLDPFVLPEAKSRVSYKSRDVLLVGSDFGAATLTDSGYPRTIREWVRGTPVEDAPVVFEGEKQDVSVSYYIDDQRIRKGGIYEVRSRALTFYTSKCWARCVEYEHLLAPNDPLRQQVADPSEFVEVDVQQDANIDFVGKWMIISLRSDWEPVSGKMFKQGSLLYVDAATFLEQGSKASEFYVLFEPTERTASEYYTATQNYLIHSILDNVKSKVEFFKIEEGGFVRVGSNAEPEIRDVSISPMDPYEGDKFWFTTSGFVQPSTLHQADATLVETKDGEQTNEGLSDVYITEKLKSLPHQYDSSDVIATQGCATSQDGTSIPYFLIRKKDTKLDGKNPTLLYGYGGFEVSLGPHYIATPGLAWIERGGVYVEANIRGGGEMGPSWHQAALKENRNKCYEDFIAVAEDLISSGLCKPSTLAVRGGSNGGLLVGNMYTMRPDLFGAIHCAVPLLDMKRFHTLLAGASWCAEYGDPSKGDFEKFLHKYSPYHNIDPSVAKYPALLVTTSTRDDRVHPAHARKMVKKLWDMGKDKDWPVFYYENIEGGHGGAADAKQSAFMTSLAFDFMFDTLSKNAEKL